jgi:hypothetical protein
MIDDNLLEPSSTQENRSIFINQLNDPSGLDYSNAVMPCSPNENIH